MTSKRTVTRYETKMQVVIHKLVIAQKKVDTVIKRKLKES